MKSKFTFSYTELLCATQEIFIYPKVMKIFYHVIFYMLLIYTIEEIQFRRNIKKCKQ